VITEADVEKVALAGRDLPPADGSYIESDFVMNLFETVLDYMLQTPVVVRALQFFRDNHWNEVRDLDELEALCHHRCT
jgi:hypothetical protein